MSLASIQTEVGAILDAVNGDAPPLQQADKFVRALDEFLRRGLYEKRTLWSVLSHLDEDEGIRAVAQSDVLDEMKGQAWVVQCLNTKTLASSFTKLCGMYEVLHSAYFPGSPALDTVMMRELICAVEPLSSVRFLLKFPVIHDPTPPNQDDETALQASRAITVLPALPAGITDMCDSALVEKLRTSQEGTLDHANYYHKVLVDYHIKHERCIRPRITVLTAAPKEMTTPDSKEPIPPILQEAPSKHRIRFYSQTHILPQSNSDKGVLVDKQHGKCKGCLKSLVATETLFSGAQWDQVHFCMYTGWMYCQKCHMGGTQTALIPARMIYHWDFTAYPVCRDASAYLEVVWTQPIVCLSALNPTLFDRVVGLRNVRQLRLQLQLFHDICKDCKAFRTAVSEVQSCLYHMESTEMYSLHDLSQFCKCNLNSITKGTFAQPEVPSQQLDDFFNTLKNLRTICVQHVLRMCRAGCYVKAAKFCGRCRATEPIFSFDINNTVACPKCEALYHRSCYKIEPCRTCYPQSVT